MKFKNNKQIITNLKSKYLSILLIVFFLNKIEAQKKQFDFTVSCHFQNDFSGYLYIKYENKLDSCLVVNNNCLFKGKLDNDIVSAGFFLNDKPSNVFGVYLESSNIELELSVSEKLTNQGIKLTFFTVESVKGSKTSIIEKDFYDFWLYNKEENYKEKLYKKADDIITQNPKNPLGGQIIVSLSKDENLDKRVLEKMYTKLDKNSLNEFTIKLIEKNLYPERLVKVEGNLFDFSLPDRNNQIFSTSSLKGKWFLIDFWASWCAPCRKQLPELKKFYEANKNKNFEIVGVSIDEKKEDWLKALEKEQLHWINVIEDKGFMGKVINKYDSNSIPASFLINPEGKVVAKNITIEELEILIKSF